MVIFDKSANLTSNGFLLFLIKACSFNSLIDNRAPSLVKNLTNANYLDFPLESIAILTYSNFPYSPNNDDNSSYVQSSGTLPTNNLVAYVSSNPAIPNLSLSPSAYFNYIGYY